MLDGLSDVDSNKVLDGDGVRLGLAFENCLNSTRSYAALQTYLRMSLLLRVRYKDAKKYVKTIRWSSRSLVRLWGKQPQRSGPRHVLGR